MGIASNLQGRAFGCVCSSPKSSVWLQQRQLQPLERWGLCPQPLPASLLSASFRAGVPLSLPPAVGFHQTSPFKDFKSLQASGIASSPQFPHFAPWVGSGARTVPLRWGPVWILRWPWHQAPWLSDHGSPKQRGTGRRPGGNKLTKMSKAWVPRFGGHCHPDGSTMLQHRRMAPSSSP